jgi:hypothetical protein
MGLSVGSASEACRLLKAFSPRPVLTPVRVRREPVALGSMGSIEIKSNQDVRVTLDSRELQQLDIPA